MSAFECPRCGCKHMGVKVTTHKTAGTIVRVRICRHCGKRVRTIERVAKPGEGM